MELFDETEYTAQAKPLADRMRPSTLTGFIGQSQLVGQGRFVRGIIERKQLPSLILWGPPGSGKTTLARIIANSVDAIFIEYSAIMSGVKEIREVAKQAKDSLRRGKKTVLFIDEIHRFNKSQQDAFLHSVEDGTITLIGATTENPSFEVNAPLLSRCKVLALERLTEESITAILGRAIKDVAQGYGRFAVHIEKDAIEFIAAVADGDARSALNCLETAFNLTTPDENSGRTITVEAAGEAMQKKPLIYDKAGEEHYNVISAFIKSMRGSDPDAALYYLARMVEAGEEALFIARRMVIFASEDIGNADPNALSVAINVKDAVHFVGMPEGWIPLAHGVTYLATAPKSNASYTAYLEALEEVKRHGAAPTPLHIRNAPTDLMKRLGYAKGYKYPHNFKGAEVAQQYLPDCLNGKSFYKPFGHGFEKEIIERMRTKKKE
ncbi:MAG: replication-associated recombination protein A [Deltaproteobacteria bacterium]|nr:replication-associated recombination protein A [Deltaproteobacteria bacterium]